MQRVLGFGHLVALGINSVIGAGIFIVPGPLAKLGILSVVVFLVSGILLHPIALCFAHLGRLTDRSGGAYVYGQMAFGPLAGFLVGWATWLTAVFSASTIGSALAIYVSYFNPSLAAYSSWISVVGIALFGVINYFGVQNGGRATTTLTILKTVPLVLIGIFGLFYLRGDVFLQMPVDASASALGIPLLMTIFTCCGFEVVPYIAGETKRPKEMVPKAILISLWAPIVLYCAVQLGVLASGSTSDTALTDLAMYVWGKTGADIVNLAGLVSVIGFLAGTMLGAPRLLMVLSEDKHLPKSLLAVHSRFQTPHISVVVTAIAAMAFSLIGDIGILISLTALAFLIQYLASTTALFVLAKQGRAPGKVVAVLGTIVTVFFLAQVDWASWAVFVATSLFGLLLRSLSMRQAK